jgi:Mn2+/Fe2+ NRAMP family transporter
MLIGLSINFIGIDPIKALIYSAVANGVVAPVILVLILLIARKEKTMGEWKNGKISGGLGWALTALMVFSGIAAIYTLF